MIVCPDKADIKTADVIALPDRYIFQKNIAFIPNSSIKSVFFNPNKLNR